jgi:hypothetical protein
MAMIDLTNTKLFSGKLIFTVVTAFVFAYAVYSKVLNADQTYGVIMLVVAAYFGKPTENKP